MSGWNYYRACEAVLEAAQLEDRSRQILGCRCGAMYLTPPGVPKADECGYCWRRARREADERADRELFALYQERGGDPLDLVRIAKPKPVVEPALQGQGALF